MQIENINKQVEMTVLVNDRTAGKVVPKSRYINILRIPDLTIAKRAKNIFVFSSSEQLSDMGKFIQMANRQHHLKALFIKEADLNLFPQILSQSNVRTLSNMVIYSSSEVPQRIIFAWQVGAQNKLIANARYGENKLSVMSCALEYYELSFDSLKVLTQIPKEERSSFEISESGSYIHWPKSDVHLDLDSIRCALNPEFKVQLERNKLLHDKRFGSAIKILRKKNQLKQSDIPGLSDRQVRRIESGEYATVDSLTILAKAHDMTLNDYLGAIAHTMKKKNL